ncbi:MAG: translation elongation factor Ts [Bacteroidales bacterium]|jgi:elongation factor Ts|nr:translation elongation factor Ts [Bacteroidales bacterium]
MAITAGDVNKLRQMTGAGMMDCKNALVEANGDFDMAIDILRKKGQKIAAKRADRSSTEGRVVAKTNAEHTFAAVVVVGCETDFVGKNADFVAFTESIIDAAMANKIQSLEELKAMSINGVSIEEMIMEMTGKTGEKVEIPAYNCIEAPAVAAYNHNGNRLATIVGLNKNSQAILEAGHNVAMQIAAMNPISLNADLVPQATIEHELEINREIIRQEGKPENMVEQIAKGKLNKFFKENTLLSQDYIKDNKLSVGDYLKQTDPELTATGFFRLQLGA